MPPVDLCPTHSFASCDRAAAPLRWSSSGSATSATAAGFFWYVAVGAAVAFVATLTLPETKGSVLR